MLNGTGKGITGCQRVDPTNINNNIHGKQYSLVSVLDITF